MSRYHVATFDCYGTLVDWEGGAAAFLYQLALRSGDIDPGPGRALRDRWEALQFERLAGPYRPYRMILAESLEAWCRERGYPYRPADGEALVEAMGAWQPFPDVRPALRQARTTGLRLVILSNTDRAIMAHTLRQLDVPFDDVIVAEDCGAYKPADEVFRFALERLGEAPAAILHVAFGFKYDIGPAARQGMGTAWVNRHLEPTPAGARPDHTWRDLWGLAELAGAAGPGLPGESAGASASGVGPSALSGPRR